MVLAATGLQPHTLDELRAAKRGDTADPNLVAFGRASIRTSARTS